jgi:hypothetical protein
MPGISAGPDGTDAVQLDVLPPAIRIVTGRSRGPALAPDPAATADVADQGRCPSIGFGLPALFGLVQSPVLDRQRAD